MTPERLAEIRRHVGWRYLSKNLYLKAAYADESDLLAEVDRLRAQVAAVEELTTTWEAIPSQLILDRLQSKTCPHGRTRCACLPNYGKPHD